ncbi:MAG: HAMP domain-containing histidine kinase [Bacteroidales bacterium]|nr:HAMP domain-containing histidine kinase [Bacteroidales bacterium]
MKQKLKWIMLAATVALALLALWQVQKTAEAIRQEEEEKVRLWANAISQRNQLVSASTQFFQEATLDEHRKMQLYTDILQSFGTSNFNTDLGFTLRYINYIVDSSRTPIIITTSADSIITVPQDLAGQKLEGEQLREFSMNPPFTYNLYGMKMTLYYKESEYYTRLREVLFGFTHTFLSDITQNSVLVPVIIVDSTRTKILAHGNMDSSEVASLEMCIANLSTDKAKDVISDRFSNDPIELTLFNGHPLYVYYSSTPLLNALRWLPLFYFFIGFVLLVVSYYLFRSARSAEQNRIWVGLAKETAHQLGTPLSSLMAWKEYLHGKVLTDEYSTEVDKDLQRLDTITHRFSKIGSTPELKPTDVRSVTIAAIDYLRSRTSRKVSINVAFPEGEEFIAPLNGHLFQWVIENLCKNAVDAMVGGEGEIRIVASQDARKIYIDVSDTGRGMTPAVQRRIFDSGFTTKTRGWGLGLPLARRIINQYHRGRLYLKYSVPGQGSTFRIVIKK